MGFLAGWTKGTGHEVQAHTWAEPASRPGPVGTQTPRLGGTALPSGKSRLGFQGRGSWDHLQACVKAARSGLWLGVGSRVTLWVALAPGIQAVL